jgi:hypothetical protein
MPNFAKQYCTAALSVFLSLSSGAQQTPEIPSQGELDQWDARFVPGQYSVTEYKLNDQGNPIPGTEKKTETCFTKNQMQTISRLPVTTAVLWQCSPIKFKLDSKSFGVVLSCPSENSNGKEVFGVVGVEKIGDSTYQSTLMKYEKGTGKSKDKLIYGAGSSFSRVGDCTK